jgi:DNA-binding NtrC family response regulator
MALGMDAARSKTNGRGNGKQIDAVLEQLYGLALDLEGRSSLELREWVERAEAWRIVEVLRECRGNRSAAARALGIGRRTLYTKMERLGVGPAWGIACRSESRAPEAPSAALRTAPPEGLES